jgi:ribosomal protein S18 acetylase RimI-like enzyme
MNIRTLNADDALTFREVRLRALQNHPEAFASDAETFEQVPLEHIASRIRNDDQHPDNFIVGAFVDGKLMGTVGLARDRQRKLQHKALIWGVYVAPEVRGQKVARALMVEAISLARNLEGLEILYLGVAVSNTPARSLYLSVGFQTYGTELHAMKLGDRYVDEDLMFLMLNP